MKKRANKKHRKQIFLLKAHRYIGIMSFLVLCWLAISGLLLNHTEGLQLDRKYSSNPILLDLYHIPAPTFKQGILLNGKWLFSVKNAVYVEDKKLLETQDSPLIGGLWQENFIAIATYQQVFLFTPELEWIDTLALQTTIKKIGLADTKIVLDTDQGCLKIDDDFMELSPCTMSKQFIWSQLDDVPDRVKLAFKQTQYGAVISLERLILDAHSGRIIGLAGVYFMDLMAIFIIMLGISGFTLWLLRKIKQYKRKVRKINNNSHYN